MQILINRTYKNKFYTEGVIKVNGKKIAHTVEDTLTMLPPGTYQIRLCRYKSKRRIIRISNTSWSIGIGLSWIRSEKHHLIAIGQPLIPGVVYKATHLRTPIRAHRKMSSAKGTNHPCDQRLKVSTMHPQPTLDKSVTVTRNQQD